MKVFISLAIILSVFSLVHLRDLQDFSHPDHPEKCVYKGLSLSSGQSSQVPGACEKLFCETGGRGRLETCRNRVPDDPQCYYGDYIHPEAEFSRCCKRYLICA